MPTAEKAKAIEEAKDWYAKSKGLVFTDYRGLKVKEIQELRRQIRSKGGEMHVIKNTLFRIAAGSDVEAFPADFHNGPTAITFVFENESAVAKSIFDYAQTHKTLIVKGGFFGGKTFDAKGVEALSKLPAREVLIAQVIGAIAAPLSNLVGVIEALYADPIRVIGAVADKVAEGAPAGPSEPAGKPAEAAPPEEAVAEPEPDPRAGEEVEEAAEAHAEPAAPADAEDQTASAEESAPTEDTQPTE